MTTKLDARVLDPRSGIDISTYVSVSHSWNVSYSWNPNLEPRLQRLPHFRNRMKLLTFLTAGPPWDKSDEQPKDTWLLLPSGLVWSDPDFSIDFVVSRACLAVGSQWHWSGRRVRAWCDLMKRCSTSSICLQTDAPKFAVGTCSNVLHWKNARPLLSLWMKSSAESTREQEGGYYYLGIAGYISWVMIGIIPRIRFLSVERAIPLAAAVLKKNLLVVHAVKELPLGNCNSGSRDWLAWVDITNNTTMVKPRATHRRRLDMPVRYAVMIQ
jgi:hypothetical protein